jgi:hypothetical protein
MRSVQQNVAIGGHNPRRFAGDLQSRTVPAWLGRRVGRRRGEQQIEREERGASGAAQGVMWAMRRCSRGSTPASGRLVPQYGDERASMQSARASPPRPEAGAARAVFYTQGDEQPFSRLLRDDPSGLGGVRTSSDDAEPPERGSPQRGDREETSQAAPTRRRPAPRLRQQNRSRWRRRRGSRGRCPAAHLDVRRRARARARRPAARPWPAQRVQMRKRAQSAPPRLSCATAHK